MQLWNDQAFITDKVLFYLTHAFTAVWQRKHGGQWDGKMILLIYFKKR